MTDTFTAYLATKSGTILLPMAGLSSVDITLGLGMVGQFSIEWPLPNAAKAGDLAYLMRKDRKILIFRDLPGHWPLLVCSGYLRAWAMGSKVAKLQGPDLNDLMARRVVAYEAGSSQAKKTDQVDDIIKALGRENLGASATDSARDMSDYGFLVAADTGAGPSVTKAFAWREIPRVVADLIASGKEDGTEVLWQIEPLGYASAMLKTWASYRADRSFPNGSPPLEFSEDRGNLIDPEYSEDWRKEANVCYAGGSGKEDKRTVQEVEGSEATDPLVRKEIFTNATAQGTDTTALTDVGNSKLQARAAMRGFKGTLQESQGQLFLIHWRLGDLVTARHLGQPHKVMIRTVAIAKRPHSPTSVLAKFSIEV
jgi:hypothetical protein